MSLSYTVSKSITIKRKKSEVFDFVSDFHNSEKWSPWYCLDPEVEVAITRSGKEEGSTYSWESPITGKGDLVCQKIIKNESLDYNMTIIKPFKSKAKVYYDFEEISENETKVTWEMRSSVPFFLFFMKDQFKAWVGMDYTRGLLMLKSYLETGKIESKMHRSKKLVSVKGCNFVGMRISESFTDMQKNMENNFGKLFQATMSAGIEMAGDPFTVYEKYDMVKEDAIYVIAIPIKQEISPEFLEKNPEIIQETRQDITTAVEVNHKGDYLFLGNAWMMAHSFVQAKKGIKLDKKNPGFEIYKNSPKDTKNKDLEVIIYVPVK